MDDEAHFLRGQAKRCRSLIAGLNDARTISAMQLLADDYDERARKLNPPELSSATKPDPPI